MSKPLSDMTEAELVGELERIDAERVAATAKCREAGRLVNAEIRRRHAETRIKTLLSHGHTLTDDDKAYLKSLSADKLAALAEQAKGMSASRAASLQTVIAQMAGIGATGVSA